MKKLLTLSLLSLGLATAAGAAEPLDSLATDGNHVLHEVVVTGTRNATDIRHLPMTISVVGRPQLEGRYQPSILPALTEPPTKRCWPNVWRCYEDLPRCSTAPTRWAASSTSSPDGCRRTA